MKKVIEENKREILDIHTHNLHAGAHAIINYNLQQIIMSPFPQLHGRNFPRILVGLSFVLSNLFGLLLSCSYPLLKGCFYSIGIHPWSLLDGGVLGQLKHFKRLCANQQIVAIGEIGFDKAANATLELQLEIFKTQIEYSEVIKKPVIIHCVKGMDALLEVKKKMNPKQTWIWHGFRGKPEQAQQLLDKGFYLSFGEKYPEETMAMMPADRLFLETDDSAVDIESLLEKAAKVRGVETEVLREAILENVEKVFFSSKEL